MKPMEIAPGDVRERLIAIGKSVHSIVGRMPVAIKEKGRPGILIADGRVEDTAYESCALESVFFGEGVRKVVMDRGKYAGIPTFVSVISDTGGRSIAAIGVIDTSGVLSLQEFAEISAALSLQSDQGARPK